MDWQATEFNTAWRHAFMGLVRKDPRFQDPAAIKESIATWTHCVRIVEAQLQRTGAWVAGERFTLADIVLGLSDDQAVWLSDQLGPGRTLQDFLRNLIIEKYVTKRT